MYTSRRSRSLTLIHYSAAWADIDKYARDHGEFCGISTSSLNDITESHKRAVRLREDANRRGWRQFGVRADRRFLMQFSTRNLAYAGFYG
jgi:hypothetical protein